MCCNFSFYIAFLLLVHMTPAILTGASNGEDFNINKVELSSLESIEEKDDKPALPNRRNRRNTISVDDVDDEENDAVFPSRPLFISKGHLDAYGTVAIPLSVGSFKRRKKRDSISTDDADDQNNNSIFRSRTLFVSKLRNSSSIPLSVDSTIYVPKRHEDRKSIDSKTAQSLTSYISFGYRDPIANKDVSYNKRSASPPDRPIGHHRPPHSVPSPRFHNRPRPPPRFHDLPPPRFHDLPPSRSHYPPPPPRFRHPPPPRRHHHHHNSPPPRFPPTPPPDYTDYTAPSSHHAIDRQDYTLDDVSSSSANDKSVNNVRGDNSTKDVHLNDKIEAIFGSSTTEKSFDGSSVIDVRMQQ